MHIGFRTSGGRGEYELVGHHQGVRASELDGWKLDWRLPDGSVMSSDLHIKPARSGKARFRKVDPNASTPQVGRQMASLLLLRPIRDFLNTADRFPVLQQRGYLLDKVGFSPQVELDETSERIVAKPNYVSIRNQSGIQHLGFDARWNSVLTLHAMAMDDEFGEHGREIRNLLIQHDEALRSGPADPASWRSTSAIFQWLDSVAGTNHAEPIDALFETVYESPEVDAIAPATELELAQLAADDIPMRIRTASIMRVSSGRGSSGSQFSHAVRTAWRHTCAFCGLRFPSQTNAASGVDAAHILAWSEYDLDDLSNGLCLCKFHHWAFDQVLLTVHYEGGRYFVDTTALIEEYGESERARLSEAVGEIPSSRLPTLRTSRPNPAYLRRLYEDIDLSNLE